MYLKQKFVLLIAVLFLCLAMNVSAEGNHPSVYSGNFNTHAMQKSMNPETWSKMMGMMMDPSNYSSSMESCAECHDADDIARYQQQFGPMMDAAFNMYKSMSPDQMMNMMGPMMGMMTPMMNMMNPMMMGSMMGPMMGMMNPMMMNPMMMGMMNPMMMGSMMGPMMGGGMNPMSMMGGTNPMGMMGNMGNMGNMNPMTQGGNNPMNMMGNMNGMMQPDQYEKWFSQMTEMMKKNAPKMQAEQ